MTLVRIFPLLALLLISLVSTPASAQSNISKQELLDADFDDLLTQARLAFEAEDFHTAIETLLLANRQEPDPRLLLNIARSFERLDNCKSALAYYAAFLRQPETDQSLVEMAQDELDDGAQSCPEFDSSLTGRLSLESDPPFAQVYIDEELVGTTPTEIIALKPGNYTIRFEKEGYTDQTEQLQVQSAQDRTLGVTLDTPSDDDEQHPTVQAPPTAGETTSAAINPIAIGIASGGVALVATGLILDLSVVPSYDKKRQALDRDSKEFADLTKTRLLYRNVFLGSYIAGGLLLASGAAWILYDIVGPAGDDPSRDAANYVLAPGFGESGTTLNLIGRF